jgi:hypothetical protein
VKYDFVPDEGNPWDVMDLESTDKGKGKKKKKKTGASIPVVIK